MLKKMSLEARVTIGMLIVSVVGVVATLFVLNYTVRSYVLEQSRDFLADFIKLQTRRHLTESDFLLSGTTKAKADFEQYSKEVLLPEMLKVNIRNQSGLIIFSTDSSLTGRSFVVYPELQQAIGGSIGVRIGLPDREENKNTGGIGEFLEIYVPAILDGSVAQVGVVEIYYDFSKIAALIWQMQFTLSVSAFIVLLVALTLFLLLLNRQVITPVRSLADAIQLFRRGERQVRVGDFSNPEMGALAQSYNEMAASLESMYESLETQVEERTKSLGVAIESLEKEKAFSQQQLLLIRTLVDSLPLAVMVAEAPSGNLRFTNKVGRETIGLDDREALSGKWHSWADKIVKADGKPYPHDNIPLHITLKTGKPATRDDLVLVTPNGKRMYLRSASAPVLDENGKMTSVVSVVQDFTKEKESERAKTEFVSLASHQLRTPLSAMKWTIELMLEKKRISKSEKERMENLAASTERLIGLVNDLLNVSRIESGKALGAKMKSDLVQLTSSTVEILREAARKKKQNLSFETSLKEAPADIIPTMHTQAVQNLIANAINYSPEKAKIDVSLSIEGGDYLIKIQNTGGFISQEDSLHIFEKFYRGVDSQRVRAEGSGLGLYITKASVETNGGQVWFESSKDNGTTFYFTVPQPK